ncbi:hypothetical protein GGI21_003017, partial [Coemansia aciculifera]
MMQSPAGTPSHLRTTFDVYGAGDSPAVSREWFTNAKVNLRQSVIACLDALVFTFETGSLQHSRAPGGRFNHGWLHLQADIMRECLAIAEALPSYPHAIAAAFRLVGCLNSLSTIVSEAQRRSLLSEQHMLRNYLQRTVLLFHQRYHFDPIHVDAHLLPEPLCAAVPRVVGRDALVLGGALDSLLVGIQLCTFPGDSTPVFVGQPPVVTVAESSARSLFLHNPSAAQVKGEVPPPSVVHEKTYVVATLHNPLPFALQLTDISLVGKIIALSEDTAGGAQSLLSVADGRLQTSGASCTMPANGQGRVLLEMTPGLAGKLQIAGIRATVLQHLSVVCLLSEEDEAKASQRLKEGPLQQRLAAERSSLLGLSSLASDSTVRLTTMNAGCSLTTSVVPALPSLSVVCCSPVFEDKLDLFEGEYRVVTLTIVNSSSHAAADKLDVLFEPLVGKAERELRTDSRLCDLTNAAFSYLNDPALPFRIEPGGDIRLQVRVAGLCGLSGGEVVVRYGSSCVSEWSRELRWPLPVSVSRLLVPAHGPADGGFGAKYLGLAPYIARSLSTADDSSRARARATAGKDLHAALEDALAAAKSSESSQKSTLSENAQDLFCLVEVDIENVSSSDVQLQVEVDLSFEESANSAALYSGHSRSLQCVKQLSTCLPGRGSVSRIAVPLPRVQLSSQILCAPIPGAEADGGPDGAVFYPWRTSLSGAHTAKDDDGETSWISGANVGKGGPSARQFVVSKSAQLSERDMSTHRAAFWYQYEVASRVRISWTSIQTGRCGHIDPRVLLCLDERSLSVMQPAKLSVNALVCGQPATYLGNRLLQARCDTRQSTTIGFVLTNRSSRDIAVCIDVRLQQACGDYLENELGDERKSAASSSDVDTSFVPALLASVAAADAAGCGDFSGDELSSGHFGFRFAPGKGHNPAANRESVPLGDGACQLRSMLAKG